MERQFVCVREETVGIMKEQSKCQCKVPCEQIQYEPSLSYAQLSKFNIDRMVLNDPRRRANVNNKFLRARELSQRVIKDIAEEDRVQLLDIQDKLAAFWEDIQVVAPALSKDTEFAELYDTIPLIDEGADLFRTDLQALGERLIGIGMMFAPVLTTSLMYIDKYLPTVVQNLMEVDDPDSESDFYKRIAACIQDDNITFHLPQYDIKDYFTHSRRKRDHQFEHTPTSNFYAVDAPEYMKVHSVRDCNDYLSLKQDLAKALASHRPQLDADFDHIRIINETFVNFFQFMYKNTSKSPTAFPKYQLCLNLMNVSLGSLVDDIDTLTEAMTDFVHVANESDVMSNLNRLQNIVLNSSLPMMAADSLQKQISHYCYWPYLEYISKDHNGADYAKVASYEVDLTNAYISYPSLRVSFGNLGEYARGMLSVMKHVIMPSLVIIDDYLEERVTKMDMANVFDSLLLQKALQDIVALSADFTSVAREFDQRFKSALHNIKLGFSFIFNTSLPVVDNDVIWNWSILEHTRQFNVSHLNDILERLYHAKFEQQGGIFAELLNTFTTDYIDPVEDLKQRVPAEIDELIKSINVMMEDLLVYMEENKMNQWFFMENFVQVDVFYKGLSYEKVSFHEGFPFLSLLGEIGGFMGLLLGASCLTIIEMVDFTMMYLLKRVRSRMTIQPARDSVALRH